LQQLIESKVQENDYQLICPKERQNIAKAQIALADLRDRA
jgi:hypothetical protein